VRLPPLQDLPNHLATAHIVAHPQLYPGYAFNGLLRSNSLLTLWFLAWGDRDLFLAARLFVALVLAVTALAIPLFLLYFGGRRHLLVALLFAWPLVHSFAVSMGFLNFAFAFALSLVLLTWLDTQARRPRLAVGAGIAALSGLVWFAHPFPVAVVGGLAAWQTAARPDWRARGQAACALLLPLAPAALLSLLTAHHHLWRADPAGASRWPGFAYLDPGEILAHLWTDVSGAFTGWGCATIVPAVLLPWLAWKQRHRELPLLSRSALAALAGAYLALPVTLANWCYLNCRLVPFLWAGLLLRLPRELPRPITGALVGCALAYSAATGVDYLRLDHDRAQLTAGIEAMPRGASLLPLMFQQRRTSRFTASLTHVWGYYTVLKDTSAPLVFAVERSYPIGYRTPPLPALVPPALDRFAELQGTPAQVCRRLGRWPVDAGCRAAWQELWTGFWRQAEPRFDHLLTWAMPDEARALIPARYHRVFAASQLEIYARDQGVAGRCAASR